MINLLKRFVCVFLIAGGGLALAGSYDDFFTAIKKNNASAMQNLLDRGLDPNLISPDKVPGLVIALRESSFAVVHVLLSHPELDVNILTTEDESPLMLAALKGNYEICLKLIEREADVNKTGWTPLHYAATGGHVKLIQLLLDHFAYIDAASPNGTTPLMMAAMYGSSSAVRLLLESGADWNLKNEKNLSALNFAMQAKKTDAVEVIAAFIRAQGISNAW